MQWLLYTYGLEDLCYTPQWADQNNNECDMTSFVYNAYIRVYIHTCMYVFK